MSDMALPAPGFRGRRRAFRNRLAGGQEWIVAQAEDAEGVPGGPRGRRSGGGPRFGPGAGGRGIGGPGFGGPGFGGPGFGGPGGPGFGGPGFGLRPPGFGPRMRHRHGRRMRGNVRAAVLALLAEQPRHGYAIMTELTERSGGLWRPSPGSVYPVLQQLEDEGLVSARDEDGRKVFSLTDEGRAYVDTNREEIGRPWEADEAGPGRRVQSLLMALTALGAAVDQVARLSDDAQATRALEALEEARRTMYRILAGDDPGSQPPE